MIPDFSSDPNRLSIKSSVCSLWRYGEWSYPVYDAEGKLVTPATLLVDWPTDKEIAGEITGFQLVPPADPNQFIVQIQGGPNIIFTLDGRAKGYYKA